MHVYIYMYTVLMMKIGIMLSWLHNSLHDVYTYIKEFIWINNGQRTFTRHIDIHTYMHIYIYAYMYTYTYIYDHGLR